MVRYLAFNILNELMGVGSTQVGTNNVYIYTTPLHIALWPMDHEYIMPDSRLTFFLISVDIIEDQPSV